MNAESGHQSNEVPTGVRAAVERERRRLMKASALLECLHVAVLYDNEINVADVVDLAHELVIEVLDALDIVNLKRAADTPDTADENERPALL